MLKEGAPDDAVKGAADYKPDSGSRSGVTRRHRMRFLMRKFAAPSDSKLEYAEAAFDLLLAVDDRLKATAHAREVPSKRDVNDALTAAESALRILLLH